MKNDVFNKKTSAVFTGIICVSLVGLSISGCASLKKKFTRKKKETKSKFIPVLEPVDYAKQAASPLKQYRGAYSLWKVWQRDYVQGLENETSDKNQKYLIEKIIVQLEEMQQYIVEEKRAGLQDILEAYRQIRKEYTRPEIMRNVNKMVRDVRRNGKKIRLSFSPDVLSAESYVGFSAGNEYR